MPITYCEPRIKTPNHLHGYASILTANGNRGPCPVGTIITGSEVLSFSWTLYVLALKRSSLSIVIFYLDGLVRQLILLQILVQSFLDSLGCLLLFGSVAGHWLCFHFDLPTGNTSSRFCIWSSQPSWWMVAYLNKSSDRGHYQWAIVCWGSSKCVKTKGNCSSSQVSMDSHGDPQAKNVARHKRVRNCDVG